MNTPYANVIAKLVYYLHKENHMFQLPLELFLWFFKMLDDP